MPNVPPRIRVLIKWALGCAAVLGCIMLAWNFFETKFFRNALPIELETQGFATTGSDGGLVSALFEFRREGCGGAIFRLTDEAREAIKTKGLAFFTNARHGRGYPIADPLHHYYTYKMW